MLIKLFMFKTGPDDSKYHLFWESRRQFKESAINFISELC